jgi:hypothetical protein
VDEILESPSRSTRADVRLEEVSGVRSPILMTYGWTFNWILLNEAMKPTANEYTMSYIVALLKNLTPKQQLYAEICFRNPLG